MFDSLIAFDIFVSVTAAIADKIPVDLMIVTVADPPQGSVTGTGEYVTPNATVIAD